MVHRRALIAGVVAALAFALTAIVYLEGGDARVDFERGCEGAFVEGFHPRERAEGKYFRWTDEESFVVLENVPGEGTVGVDARLRTTRPEGATLPMLSFTANGVTVHRTQALPGVVSYRFEFPSSASSLKLGIESETFEAGGGRRLGVQVLGIDARFGRAAPSFLAPALWMAGAALLLVLAGLVARLPFPLALAAALVLVILFAHLLSLGPVRFSAYPRDVFLLAASMLGAAALLRVLFDRLRYLSERDRAWAIGLLVLVLLLKLGALSYPLMLSSDADFQANRMRQFLHGNLHPTSVTQHEPPFRIPYPVALYAVAAPLAAAGVELVPALEVTTALFDVLVSGLLLVSAVRFLDDLRAGLLAAALYALVPMNALSFSAGNFTNVFAVSMLTATFALVSVPSRWAVGCASLATFLAVTAHFGMLVEASVLVTVWLGLFWLGPAPATDRRRLLTLSLAASFVLAGIYYLGYLELVTSQWGRALSGGASAAGVDWGLVREQVGLVFLLTAVLGSLAFVRRPLQGPFSALATGWVAVTVLFLLLDLATPFEVRYWLQALPLLALFSGSYLSKALDRGAAGRTAAVAALAYMSFLGLRALYETAVIRYH